MGKLTAKAKTDSESELAFGLFTNLLEAKHAAGIQFLRIGEALTLINEQELYKYFDCSCFEHFIAIPEIGFARSTARLFMHVYDKFIRQLGREQAEIAEVEISKLQTILPVVDKNPGEWIAMASTLGRYDLKNAVRQELGQKELEIRRPDNVDNLTADYILYAREHGCVVCGRSDCDLHHFPVTRGAGGADNEVIPLCRQCHTEYHNDPHAFILKWEDKIFGYFYETIQKLFALISERQ